MIVAFWILSACIFDTPERRLFIEARRIAEVLEIYNTEHKKPFSQCVSKQGGL